MDVNLTATLISALGSIFAIYIAVVALRKENKRSAMLMMVDMGEKFFDSPEYAHKRLVIAQLMEEMQKAFVVQKELFPEKDDDSLRQMVALNSKHSKKDIVFNYFETIGYLAHGNAIPFDFVASYFTYWVYHYWTFFKYNIEQDRAVDPGCWAKFEWFYGELVRLKYVERRNKDWNFTDFIEYELENCRMQLNFSGAGQTTTIIP